MKGEKRNIEISCACGCGQSLIKYDKQGRPRRFINGHNGRGNKYRLGIKHPESFKQMMRERMSGENHPQWKGGRAYHSGGYILVHAPEHPHKHHGNYIFEHRLVMEQHLGRYLEPDERVHHINGIRDDNRLENLKLFSSDAEHAIFEGRGIGIDREKAIRVMKAKAAERHRKRGNPLIECACGCGKSFLKYDERGRTRRYVHGHGRWQN
ncbi:hypothetical protein LCGC14_3023240 [marine sediment metagenome]|uniref:HNH nuclease domain-containing protein n=1 Tax=marine sediment metagenome TaxID=412755 RepID=A0A0F8XHQ5_9ZZZZ